MPQLDRARLDLQPQYQALLAELLVRHVPHAEVWAYGSRVNGGGHECSDLDIVLRDPQDVAQALDGWLDLKEALQASALPILVDVHLWSLLPASFHREIERGYVVLQHGR